MTSRVLIADDSLTIQKVIGITLANSGYELVETLNEADMFKKIQANHFDLILLDFNLSDTLTGYELSKKVSFAKPEASIIVMLGTFDAVDESQFEKCGISDKIIKPFESSKFIKKCRDLIEAGRPAVEAKLEKLKSPAVQSDEADLWKVDAPLMHSNDPTQEEDNAQKLEEVQDKLDPLSSEIEGWGFRPTSNIEEKFQKVFPPIIEEASAHKIVDRLQEASQFMNTFDIDIDVDENEAELKNEKKNEKKNESLDLDATNPSYSLPEDLNRSLLEEIDEEVTPEAFWAVDEIVPRHSEDEEDIGKSHLNETTEDLTPTVQLLQQAQSAANNIHFNQDELIEKLKLALRPAIEEMVKEYCRQSAEKIAWEIIPDLAENLIRKEIKNISENI